MRPNKQSFSTLQNLSQWPQSSGVYEPSTGNGLWLSYPLVHSGLLLIGLPACQPLNMQRMLERTVFGEEDRLRIRCMKKKAGFEE